MGDRKTRIVLASSSPRRRELLSAVGIEFEIDPGETDETLHPDEAPADYIMRLARAKVAEAARRRPDGIVIGADTVVVVDGEILGKPADDDDARRMLGLLSGRWHQVMTGVAVVDALSGREVFDYAETEVRFAELSEEEIEWYISTGEHRDKAGAYAIQGRASLFAEEVRGNYCNVVGLPVPLVYRLGRKIGCLLIELAE